MNRLNSYANRGMNLENDLNDSNSYYLEINKAVIYKKPTPIQITRMDYRTNTIKEAYFKTPSTTDYNGLYKGKYIDFEAKEVKNKVSLPLSNIHHHQITHMKKIIEHDGIAFIIVRFTDNKETYLLKAIDLMKFIDNEERKSIPLTYFKEKGYLVKEKLRPRLDYLEIVDKILEEI